MLKPFLPSLFLFLVFPLKVFAIDSESDRESVISSRSKRFYKSNSARQYVAFGGGYASDQNSKDYNLNSRYLYQSNKFINEASFLHESKYANLSSANSQLVKKSELYDLSLSNKTRIFETRNYGVLYHRTIYDDLSKYYYDLRSAVGVGRMFFNEKVEFDIGAGYLDSKTYGYKTSLVTSMRVNLKISDRITLSQRGYVFTDQETLDNELKTSLVYRLGSKISFEIRHIFEQRRYEDNSKRIQNNLIYKSLTFGFVFDLE